MIFDLVNAAPLVKYYSQSCIKRPLFWKAWEALRPGHSLIQVMSTIPTECNEIGNYSVNSYNEEVVHLTKGQQGELLYARQYECLQRMKDDPHILQGAHCPRVWDNVMCWGDTPAGTVVCQQCPGYINNFKTNQFASRVCLSNGDWGSKPDLNVTSPFGWTNYSACLTFETELPPADPPEDVPTLIVEHIKEMRIMYNIGYGLSLVSLILAFIIMVRFRKLHCSRNTIHIHLFSSFILRASISLIRENFMVGSVGFRADLAINDTTGAMFFVDGPHWGCRLFSAVSNYTIACSYMWIFLEAVFLHMLIHVNVLSETTKVAWYIVIGWSIPLVVVVTWSVTRVAFDNYLCWNTHTRLPGLVWIIQGPIILTVVINFLFFISIIRTLYTKLSASKGLDSKRNRYRRMAKSILLLIPVFGVYYVVFTIPIHRFNETVAFVMLFIEMFFNSYQGFFIATVLCFINAEVRTEIRRAWTQNRLRSGSFGSHASKMNSHHISRDMLESGCNGTNHKPPNRRGQPRPHGTPKVFDKNATLRADHEENTPFMTPEVHNTRDDLHMTELRPNRYNGDDHNENVITTEAGEVTSDNKLRDESEPVLIDSDQTLDKCLSTADVALGGNTQSTNNIHELCDDGRTSGTCSLKEDDRRNATS